MQPDIVRSVIGSALHKLPDIQLWDKEMMQKSFFKAFMNDDSTSLFSQHLKQ